MPVLPNTRAEVVITLVATDTFEAITGAAVDLQQYDPAIGDFRTIESLVTAAGGQVRGSLTLPSEPGTYRYRAFFPGSPELRPDRSPEVRVTVAQG